VQVALKTLIVVHRLLREGDPTFKEEFLAYSYRGNILHLANFKDDSSPLGTSSASCSTNCETLIQYVLLVNDASFTSRLNVAAWDCSAWARAYALFLEERLECFRALRYDIETERLFKSPQCSSKVVLPSSKLLVLNI
jgi:hypothetical protein